MTRVSRFYKAFANGSLPNIKFWKTLLSKMVQSGGYFIPEPFSLLNSFQYVKVINSIANSYEKN